MKFLISFVISVFVTVIIYLIKAVSITDSKRIKLLKKAMDEKHVVHSKLIKSKTVRINNSVHPQDIDMDENVDMGIYQYEYNGKIYTSKIFEKVGHLKDEVDLFYVNNPKKATSEYNLGKTEIDWKKYFLVSFIVILIILYI